MTVYNSDGSVYQTTGSLRQYDPNSPDHDLLNLWDEELIKVAGTPLFYYEVRIQEQTIDPIWVEDRGKIWLPNPVVLYAYYEPVPSQNFISAFGIDGPDELIFQLNYKATLCEIEKALGDRHVPKIGSRLKTPHRRENWELIQNNLNEFKKWGIIRLEMICRKFQESVTTNEGKIPESAIKPGIEEILDCNRGPSL